MTRLLCVGSGFHHDRLKAQQSKPSSAVSPSIPVTVRSARRAAPCLSRCLATSPGVILRRPAASEDELWQVASLRARSFYAYPAGREFAGQVSERQRSGSAAAALLRAG